MDRLDPLPASALRHEFTNAELDFNTTSELCDVFRLYEEARAEDAIQLGLELQRPGYNVFAMGPDGQRCLAIVREFVEAQAKGEPVGQDLCFVHNFEAPDQPKAFLLDAGRGRVLDKDLSRLVADLEEVLRAAFESEQYRTRRQEIESDLTRQRDGAYRQLQDQAESQGIRVELDRQGLIYRAMRDGEVLSPEEFDALDDIAQAEIKEKLKGVKQEIQALTSKLPKWRRRAGESIRELDRETARDATLELFEELIEAYGKSPEVVAHLRAMHEDSVELVMTLLAAAAHSRRGRAGIIANPQQLEALKRRYQVNLLVDRSKDSHAPVVYEDDPTFARLVGRVEKRSEAGTVSSDVHTIRAGTLHYANGGYLLVDAHELLTRPLAWPALKHAIKTSGARIRSASRVVGTDVSELLDPQEVPLKLKVIVVGTPRIYYMLHRVDPDFRDLFKVLAEFDPDIERNTDSVSSYACTIATMGRELELLPLQRDAVARVMQYSLRLSGDRCKFTTDVERLADLMREADFQARKGGHTVICEAQVTEALEARQRRLGRRAERAQESIRRDFIKIASDGSRIGTVNALTVSMLGDFMFGRPNRMTARVHMGQGKTIDIEREAKLGGSLHSKGVMILSGYIGAHYARKFPLAITATLVFEQSYGRIDGDSASSAELYALLSAIAEVPLRQDLAVTGSVNQFGEIQAIGGVNEKIEGFFDCCRARGLTGRQGVIIPRDNVDNMMLNDAVVDAVSEGNFHIYAIAHVDEGIELLTGMPAGEIDEDEIFPEGTFNDLVLKSLVDIAMRRRDFNRAQRKASTENGDAEGGSPPQAETRTGPTAGGSP
ncbi:MAG: ATP-binding protein [Pseudomonadota bacterium]